MYIKRPPSNQLDNPRNNINQKRSSSSYGISKVDIVVNDPLAAIGLSVRRAEVQRENADGADDGDVASGVEVRTANLKKITGHTYTIVAMMPGT